MVALHAFYMWQVRREIARGDPDFTTFYTAGHMLRSGQGSEIYDPAAQSQSQLAWIGKSEIRRGPLLYIHPPFEAPLFVPFSLFEYRTAFVLWDFFNLVLVLASAAILRRTLLTGTRVRTWEIALGLLAFFPIFMNFFQGQDAILLLLFVVLALRAIQKGENFTAGCWLGAGLIRFHLVIPLVLILAPWGRRRIAIGFAAVGTALLLISFATVGVRATMDYPGYLWRWLSVPGLGRTPSPLLPSLAGLVSGWPGLDHLQWLLRAVVVVASTGLLLMVARLKHAAFSKSFDLSFGCAILVSVLVGYNTSTYDLALLVLPISAVANFSIREWRGRTAVALLLPVAPLLVSPFWFMLGMYWQKFNLIAIFLIWWLFAIWKVLQRMRPGVEEGHAIAPVA
jgi:Glycosyltransferase family 87